MPDAPQQYPLLTYHELTSEPSQDQYMVGRTDFEEHLRFIRELADRGFLAAGTYLCFDDGHQSNSTVALALLEKYRLRAIFFITAGWTGIRASSMNWDQLAELKRAGHLIQAHGWSHKFLTHCTGPELVQELQGPKMALEDRLGDKVESISMPGGRWNSGVVRACIEAGYTNIYTSDPLLHSTRKGPAWIHGRMMVRRHTRTEELRKFLCADRWYWMKLQGKHGLKQGLRRVLGDSAYQSVWSRISSRHAADMDSGPIPEPDKDVFLN
ncbi:MAG TPA: polysaccharide deacetylase family protein [Candidatus Angelobacter sp.]|nr:polysaccharide deacetylase family protein [Candidatus Angelobacter sp.]